MTEQKQNFQYETLLEIRDMLALKKRNQLLVSQVLEWFRKDEGQ